MAVKNLNASNEAIQDCAIMDIPCEIATNNNTLKMERKNEIHVI